LGKEELQIVFYFLSCQHQKQKNFFNIQKKKIKNKKKKK